jgi:hypothetical protein
VQRELPEERGEEPDHERRWLPRLLVLLGLWGFACTQPVLATLGDEPSFFIFRETGTIAAVLFAVALAVVPPIVLVAANALVDRIDRRAGRIFHLATVGVLATVAVHVILRRAGLVNALASVLLAVLLGAAFTWAYSRLDAIAIWARYTAILPALAVATFLFFSPASEVFSASASADQQAGSGREPSVVFLVLDELPTKSLLNEQDQIDPVRFPNLAAFAEDSTWYRRYTTVATSTRQAVPALLSGVTPSGEEALMANHPDNLFTLLQPTHDMRVSESRTWLCGFEDCRGGVSESASLSRQLRTVMTGARDLWEDQVQPGAWEELRLDDFAEDLVTPTDATEPEGMTAPVVSAPARFVDFLDSIEEPTRPTLWYQHLLMPHQPWHVYPDGQEYTDPEPPARQGPSREWISASQEQQHIFQAQYADQLVGELMARVKEAGLYEDSLIVVVADHGISFDPDASPRRFNEGNADGVAFSPFLIKAPGQADGVIDDQALMSIDLIPTLAQVLEIDVPWEVDGAAEGSSEIEERGSTRVIYDFGSFENPEPRETFHFDDTEQFPSAQDRWIRNISADEPPLRGLVEVARSGQWLGKKLDDLTSTVDGTATIPQLGEVEAASVARPGFLEGEVQGMSGDGRVLVAVDGVVVSAAPARVEKGKTPFRAMLPPGIDPQADVEVRVAWVPGLGGDNTAGLVELGIER